MKYKAFISYSHAADGKLAPALQKALQVLAKPWYKAQVFDVFRDETDLSTSPHLWNSIEEALKSSEYLILLASPESAASKWVRKEIDYWLEHRSIETLLLVLTEGDIGWDEKKDDFSRGQSTSVPDVLYGQFSGEPLYVDLRFVHKDSDLTLENNRFAKAIHPIAATLHDKSVADLFGEIQSQHKKTLRLRNAIITVLSFLLCLSIAATIFARIQRQRAVKEQSRAESNLLAVYSNREYGISPTKSYRFAEAAFLRDRNNPTAYSALLKAFHNPYPFFGIFAQTDTTIHFFDISFDRQNYLVLSGAYSDTLSLLILDLDGKEIRKTKLRKNISKVYLSPDGEYILSIDRRHYQKKSYDVQFWDMEGHPVKTCCRHENEIESLAFSFDGQYILTAGLDHKAVVWNMEGVEVQRFPHPWQVSSAVFSPDGKSILTTCRKKALIWDMEGNVKLTLTGHQGILAGAIYVANGQQILTFGWDKTAILWDKEGVEISRFGEYDQWITGADFEPNNSSILLVSGNSAYVLDNNTQLNILKSGSDFDIHAALFSPDGKYILTTGRYENTILLWEIKEAPALWDMENLPVECSSLLADTAKVLFPEEKYRLNVNDGNVLLFDTLGREILDFGLEGALNAHFSDDFRNIVVSVSATVPVAFVFLIDPDEIMKSVNAQLAPFSVWRLDDSIEMDYGINFKRP